MSAAQGIIREDAVALVTGAATGIGQAVVTGLVHRQVRVACADRDVEKLTAFADEVGTLARPVVIDLDDSESVRKGVNSLPMDWQRIDILTNNAGHAIGGQRPYHLGRLADWEGIIETNLQGMLNALQKFEDLDREQTALVRELGAGVIDVDIVRWSILVNDRVSTTDQRMHAISSTDLIRRASSTIDTASSTSRPCCIKAWTTAGVTCSTATRPPVC